VRRVALYGTKRLIEDKRNYLKTLEKHLQTYEWIQKRILIHREIDSLKQLEQFCKKYNINISKPANNAKEAVTFTYLTILANVLENPSVPFTLTNVIPFLDVYIENDIASGLLKENQAQELIDQFYLKLCMIRFTYSPGLIKNKDGYMQMFGETFGPVVTKSTYRILQSVKKISVFPFTIRVIWEKTLPKAFKQEIEELLRLKLPIYIVNPRVLKGKKDIAILPNGGFGKTGEEMNFPAGSCDLEKVFYLAINGGKDVTTNTNLASITQPIKNKEIDYEETMGKFKDYLSYVLSSYVEMMNVVLHLNVSNNNHPLRNALMNNLNKYIIQFAFHNLEKIALLFSNIDKNTYEAKIDKNGWIENVIPMEKEAKDYEIIYAHILTFIETELRKIPIFNTGIASIRIHQRDPQFYFTNETIAQIWTLPPEFTNSTFHVSLKLGEETDYATFVEKMFNQDVHELNIFFDDEDKLLNGIIYKKSFKYQ
jgi:pyruvate-formate lyase